MSEWIEALDGVAAMRAAAQTRIDLDKALVINQNEMLQVKYCQTGLDT